MGIGRYTKSLIVRVLGWAFIMLGVIGLFLPILQGILFLAIGMVLLSRESPWIGNKLVLLEKRYPKYGRHLRGARIRAILIVRRIFRQTRIGKTK